MGRVTGTATMSAQVSLTEHVVLGLINEHPTHGFAVARTTADEGAIGRVYRIPRPVVYRALERLTVVGLVRPVGVEASSQGPQRTVLTVTPGGRRVNRRWLLQPVGHVRQIRTELLVKLALLERAGEDPAPLIAAQRSVLAPIVEALAAQHRSTDGFDRTLLAWRYETAQATLRLLDDIDAHTRPPGLLSVPPDAPS